MHEIGSTNTPLPAHIAPDPTIGGDGAAGAQACLQEFPAAADRPAWGTVRPSLPEAPGFVDPLAIGPLAVARILVVGDDDAARVRLTRDLQEDGHHVAFAAGGSRASCLSQLGDVDLVLLELVPPFTSAIELLGQLRAEPSTAQLPMIVISPADAVDAAVRCVEAGANDYLTQPLNRALLRSRVAAALDRKQSRDREQAITQQLRAERQRSDSLLRNLLPQTIIDRLNQGESVIADHFDCATILFCDLVGFTPLSSGLAPQVTLDLLNGVFSGFDRLAARHRLEKIKTIGDGYMVAGGLPEVRSDHARSVAEMALGMEKVVEDNSRRIGRRLDIRIGIHTGPVVAGIIGIHKFVYDVWGDTVNIASRMENHGAPGRIHVSAATREALGDCYRFDPRAPMDIKGKGIMQTYFLEGRLWDHAAWPALEKPDLPGLEPVWRADLRSMPQA